MHFYTLLILSRYDDWQQNSKCVYMAMCTPRPYILYTVYVVSHILSSITKFDLQWTFRNPSTGCVLCAQKCFFSCVPEHMKIRCALVKELSPHGHHLISTGQRDRCLLNHAASQRNRWSLCVRITFCWKEWSFAVTSQNGVIHFTLKCNPARKKALVF